ncbi:MAG: signal peptidase I [Dehalococcoidia bacterium]|nr:signal peptidase I [Dehalococcoidia bacterium]
MISPRRKAYEERKRKREQRQAPQAGVGGATGAAPGPAGAPLDTPRRKGLAMPSRPQIQRFLAGALLGLTSGLALLVAMTLLPVIFGFYPMVVLSGSMEPTIHVGDIAVVRKQDPYAFQIGDVVTYSTAGGNITHRIVGLDVTPQGPFFLMRGDANLTADPRAIPAQAIVGKVVYRVPRLGFLSPSSTPRRGASCSLQPPCWCWRGWGSGAPSGDVASHLHRKAPLPLAAQIREMGIPA